MPDPKQQAAEPASAKTPVSTDFKWQRLTQIRLHVSVGAVIDLVTSKPYPIQNISLNDWSLGAEIGFTYVRHVSGIKCAYHQHKLPQVIDLFPVLIGTGNGKQFLIDGAHRMAKYLLGKRPTIPAIVLTEAETRSCVRKDMEAKFDSLIGLKPSA
jgi:hypothetical protein